MMYPKIYRRKPTPTTSAPALLEDLPTTVSLTFQIPGTSGGGVITSMLRDFSARTSSKPKPSRDRAHFVEINAHFLASGTRLTESHGSKGKSNLAEFKETIF